jgi:hypothetical protein
VPPVTSGKKEEKLGDPEASAVVVQEYFQEEERDDLFAEKMKESIAPSELKRMLRRLSDPFLNLLVLTALSTRGELVKRLRKAEHAIARLKIELQATGNYMFNADLGEFGDIAPSYGSDESIEESQISDLVGDEEEDLELERSAKRKKSLGRKRAKKASKYKGVYWAADRNKWRAHIQINGKKIQFPIEKAIFAIVIGRLYGKVMVVPAAEKPIPNVCYKKKIILNAIVSDEKAVLPDLPRKNASIKIFHHFSLC